MELDNPSKRSDRREEKMLRRQPIQPFAAMPSPFVALPLPDLMLCRHSFRAMTLQL